MIRKIKTISICYTWLFFNVHRLIGQNDFVAWSYVMWSNDPQWIRPFEGCPVPMIWRKLILINWHFSSNSFCGVMVSVVMPQRLCNLELASSPLSTQHQGVRAKTGWLRIRIMCLSGTTCLHADFCFTEVVL
jgi:hypothetical protein